MKKILLIIFLSLVLVGCTKEEHERIYLSDIYYNKGEYKEVVSKDLKTDETYLLFIYNSYCNLEIPCDTIFKEFMEKYKIDILSMTYEEFQNTSLYETVKYAPSVILVSNNKVITYLDANKDEDLNKYQDSKEFGRWLKKYIFTEKEN